ncbi:MAG: hypothetical protein FJY20_09270 [Bacteroidetes bacterium]|nr:hypothetical protein [Bacteroidota bacterium]
MNPRINQLVKSLLQKDSLDQCSLPELQQFAERHPYFGAAQLLLTKKMQSDSPEEYHEQLQKTLLFFHNPLWVEHMLNDTGTAEILKARKEAVMTNVVVAEPAENTVTDKKGAGEFAGENILPGTVPIGEMESTPEKNPAQSLPELPSLKTEAAVNAKDELVFEPFHTVDYFASQGIRLKEEEKPKDKLGQQLKSFTEWLKVMKRLPIAEIVKSSEPAAERKVEEMAETSLQDREIITETMAEVWEKQGNITKAIEIYSKLSLLEPSKIAYFAAKIEDLKKQI